MTTIQTIPPIQLLLEAENTDTNTDTSTDTDTNISALLFVSGPFLIYGFWLGLLVLIWVISGFLAFLASFVCLFYNSSIGDKMAGLILALFAGPFYWLFYIYNSNYCKSYATYNY
jgi:hypothetical protein